MIKLKYGEGSIRPKTRVRKKDGSIYKIYEGKYYNEYGQCKSVYGKTQKECLQKLREANPKKKTVARQRYVTLKDWLLEWFNTFRRNKVRPSTIRSYETLMHSHIIPALGKYKLFELTGERLQRFFNSISAANTRKKVLTFLTSCLDKAVALQKVTRNNCILVELPRYKKKKRRAFTYAEQELILEKGNDVQKKIFFFLCCTGLRVGEFLALRKEDFNLEENYFIVDKSISEGEESDCKTEASNRIIYFTGELIESFDFELLGKYTYAGLRTSFRRLLNTLSIEGVSLHCCRHTFATVCHSLYMNEKTLQSLLGHSTLAMTQDVYTHLMKKGSSKIRSYLEKFCAFMRTLI